MLLVIAGNIIFAIGVNVIITPMNLYSSGFTGLSMLIRMFLVDILHVPQIPSADTHELCLSDPDAVNDHLGIELVHTAR